MLAGSVAARAEDLFACRVIVTGTEAALHSDALERCARQVVVRLTGQPSLAEDRRADAIVAAAPSMVEDEVFVDRMSDIPHHDEQGTRERPYDLVVHFDPERMAASLAGQGLAVWRERPALLLAVSVDSGRETYRLDADGDTGERQREAALEAGSRFGMRVVLPTRRQVAAGSEPPVRGKVARLEGVVRWSPADHGWNGSWALGGERWEVRGVSFDEAYRSGIGGAAGLLSR